MDIPINGRNARTAIRVNARQHIVALMSAPSNM